MTKKQEFSHIWFFERLRSAKEKNSQEPLEWDAFSKLDSLRLEESYTKNVDQNGTETDAISLQKITVGNGKLWEVDIVTLEMTPIYWSNEKFHVRRSNWHFKPYYSDSYHPVSTLFSLQIEEAFNEFQKLLSNESVSDSMKEPSVHFIKELSVENSLDGLQNNPIALSENESESHMYVLFLKEQPNVAWLHRSKPSFEKKFFSKSQSGQKIYHYSTGLTTTHQKSSLLYSNVLSPEALDLENSTTLQKPSKRTIKHLLLCVHGIGQKFFEKADNNIFSRDVELLRDTCMEIAKKFNLSNDFQILPIQWRLNLNFGGTDMTHEEGGNEFDDCLRRISLPSISSVRSLMSDVALDILLYMSPEHYAKIMTRLVNEMNQVYELFVKNNPQFSGHVSILAHSLGSILAFDLLSCTYEGSPLSVFLLIKGINLNGTRKATTYCNDFYNIFHPNDPCAFRVEPLLSPKYRDIPPFSAKDAIVQLPKVKTADTIARLTESLRSIFYSSTAVIEESTISLKTEINISEKVIAEQAIQNAIQDSNALAITADSTSNSDSNLIESNDSLSKLIENAPNEASFFAFNDFGRIDFTLSERMLEYSYLSMLSAHSQYWKDRETCKFIVNRLRRDADEEIMEKSNE